jgi:hypothetical protein
MGVGTAGAGLDLMADMADAYAEFLLADAAPARGERLAAVASQAYPVECELLHRHRHGGAQWTPVPAPAPAPTPSASVSGPWTGRRCWVGARPPGDTQPGDLWFDIVEFALAVFVSTAARRGRGGGPPGGERAPWRPRVPQEAWLSLRPMSVWQVAGYCRAVGRNIPVSLADALSRDALSRHASRPDGCAFASGLRFPDADPVTAFFGKSTCDYRVWCAASATLSPDEFGDMWPGEAPEFGGEVNSGVYLVLRREDAWWPDIPNLDDSRPDNPRLVCDGEAVPGVRFRTAALLHGGETLFSAADADGLPVFDREAVGDR